MQKQATFFQKLTPTVEINFMNSMQQEITLKSKIKFALIKKLQKTANKTRVHEKIASAIACKFVASFFTPTSSYCLQFGIHF